ncbi:MAG: hypothetical protein QOE74_2290 [Mycobacterium sp.]|jgi:hypothetical protein|nr:hypothetical protein [Mycobacterium sp.]
MNPLEGASRLVVRSAEATVGAAGALGGAMIGGVVGGVRGTVGGIKAGLSDGSQSTPAAALTLGAIGAAGLVEWPVLLGIGGTALVIRQLNKGSGRETTAPTLVAVDDQPASRPPAGPANRRSPRNGATKAPAARTPRKSASSGRQTPTKK